MGRRERQLALNIAEEVAALPIQEQSDRFFELVRASEIPYYAVRHHDNALKLFVDSFEALYILGRASLPLAVGLTMHQYMVSALATCPVGREAPLGTKRDRMLADLEKHRLLVAVASFGDNLRERDHAPDTLGLVREGDGWLASGRKVFNSLCTVADLLVFTGEIPEGQLALFITSLKGNAALRPGSPLFLGPMADTDTRPLEFDSLRLGQANLLLGDSEATLSVLTFATAWFQALVAGAYLGAASGALEEVRRFVHSVHTADGLPLAELDGVRADVGRLALRLQASVRLAHQFGHVVATLNPENLGFVGEQVVGELIDFASQIKYLATEVAEEVVAQSRRLIGTRAMAPGHPVSRLSGQIIYGALHPLLSAQIERDAGQAALAGPFLGLPGY